VTHRPDLVAVDLYPLIVRCASDYVAAVEAARPFAARVNKLYYAPRARRLFVIFAEGYVFASDDGLESLQEVREINYSDRGLVPFGDQTVDAVVETADGTVVFAGRDRREGHETGVVWRRPMGAQSFERRSVCDPAWLTTKTGNLAAGFLGPGHARVVALAIYSDDGAHFYYSLDDGLAWHRQDMGAHFYHHVHEIYLPRKVTANRFGRMWMTGGDDPSGARSGVLCVEGVNGDGTLTAPRWVMRERPGYRLVGIAGDGKHVFVGNESLAGGALKFDDNAESIEAGDAEYVFGKGRHDYHLCGVLLAASDGLLISGTSSFSMYAGDTLRSDAGGVMYVSNDEGATFREIPLGAKWVASIADDGRDFWIATSATREYGPDVSTERFLVWRLRRPSPYDALATPHVAKVLIRDSSAFYEAAGYASHPRASLAPGERTPRADLSAYRHIALSVDATEAGTLVIEAAPFYDWRLADHPWMDVTTVSLDGPGRREVLLSDAAALNRCFRVRNAGRAPVGIRHLAFLAKR
jgi:hypothetical protein